MLAAPRWIFSIHRGKDGIGDRPSARRERVVGFRRLPSNRLGPRNPFAAPLAVPPAEDHLRRAGAASSQFVARFEHLGVELELVEEHAGATRDAGQRILGDVDRELDRALDRGR